MASSIPKSVFFSYLSGKATPIEAQSVEEWIKNPVNQEHFFSLLLEWEREQAQFSPDPEKAIHYFHLRIENPESSLTTPIPSVVAAAEPRKRSNLALSSLAACLALLLTVAWVFKDEIRYQTIRTPYGEIQQHKLPDGSKVTLNANSSLRFPRFGFRNQTREVWLSGEAEFSVVHTPTNKRFIVKTTKDFQVEVLGTEFSVFTRTRGTKVVLNSGKIRVDYTKQGKPAQLTMKPGDLLKMDQRGDIHVETTETPEKHSAWKERRFVFDGTPVSEICLLLEENFGLIACPSTKEIGERKITGNFETQTQEELLDIIRAVSGLETRQQNDTLFLYQKFNKIP